MPLLFLPILTYNDIVIIIFSFYMDKMVGLILEMLKKKGCSEECMAMVSKELAGEAPETEEETAEEETEEGYSEDGEEEEGAPKIKVGFMKVKAVPGLRVPVKKMM